MPLSRALAANRLAEFTPGRPVPEALAVEALHYVRVLNDPATAES